MSSWPRLALVRGRPAVRQVVVVVLGYGRPSGIPVRDSKTPHGPAILFPADSWIPFVTAVKNGEFPASAG
ncbi:DUF397 domain-containing protein [Streptomyces sioyaensis]|uniref:DUF397 domain-containing protein n=1 Tax=Streptomyces sioyaensis TaxID=67364 RepID=UPI0033CDC1B3